MRTSITFRLLLLTNLLVLATVAAVALLASNVSATVVERRLVRDTALQTARFLQSSRLPFSNRLMQDLRGIFGNHFAVAGASEQGILGTSFSSERAEELRRRLRPDDRVREVRVGKTDYRVGSHSIRRKDASGEAGEAVRLFVFMPADEVERAGRRARERTLVAAAPAVVVATLLGLGLSLTITRPIRRLAREMDRIAASQADASPAASPQTPADTPSTRGGPREVAQLATSFDRLLARLANVQDELIRSQRLAALGKVAASAAHELKNPLSAIRMHLRLLQDDATPESRREDIDMLVREVERMDLYLQELTDLAADRTPDAGPERVPPGSLKTVDLSETVDSVLRLLESRCRHAGVAVERDYHVGSPQARAAPKRLRQVLMNLLINAIEAMPGGGSITVSTRASPPGRVRLSVTDTGGGVREQPPERVFDLFSSTKEHSSGLGLYITRQLVQAQGGEVGCENTADGARFWIDLPAGAENGPARNEGATP
ncbi:MAG: ATP-binding protein [Planctomycetota bacterium]